MKKTFQTLSLTIFLLIPYLVKAAPPAPALLTMNPGHLNKGEMNEVNVKLDRTPENSAFYLGDAFILHSHTHSVKPFYTLYITADMVPSSGPVILKVCERTGADFEILNCSEAHISVCSYAERTCSDFVSDGSLISSDSGSSTPTVTDPTTTDHTVDEPSIDTAPETPGPTSPATPTLTVQPGSPESGGCSLSFGSSLSFNSVWIFGMGFVTMLAARIRRK